MESPQWFLVQCRGSKVSLPFLAHLERRTVDERIGVEFEKVGGGRVTVFLDQIATIEEHVNGLAIVHTSFGRKVEIKLSYEATINRVNEVWREFHP
jgi:hypothetical protein